MMSWEALEPVVKTAPPAVRDAARSVVEARDPRDRQRRLRSLIEVLGPEAGPLLHGWAASTSAEAHVLVLEILRRARQFDPSMRRVAEPLLRDRSLPVALRAGATQNLLSSTDGRGPAALRLLRAFAAGLGRKRVLDRIDRIAGRLGNPPALAVVREELRDRQRLLCPRCGAQRRRRRMAAHLWNHHQLLLDGHRVKSPLQVLDDLLANPDPQAALEELHRSMLARGLKDSEALSQLEEQAARRHESLCPHCFAFVPVGQAPPLKPAEVSARRLFTPDASVTIEANRWRSRLVIEVRGRRVLSGTEPGSGWSALAHRCIAALCGVAGSVSAAFVPVPWHALTSVALFGEAAVFLGLARLADRRNRFPTDRLIDHAWQHLPQHLPIGETLGRFALASVGRGEPNHRIGPVQAAINAPTSPEVLAAFWWLHADDDRRLGRDLVPDVVGRLAGGFRGGVSLPAVADFANLVIDRLPGPSDLVRVRALGIEQAFEAGLHVWDLAELGRAFPALGRLLGTENWDGLARLRHVWEQRERRPWLANGPMATVFELSRHPAAAELLARSPDLLLYQPMNYLGGGDPEPLVLGGRGVLLRDTLIRERPAAIRVRAREGWRGGGFELRLGPYRARFDRDPTPLVSRIQGHVDYWFREFLPGVDGVMRYRAGTRLAGLLKSYQVACPSCGRECIPIAGRTAFLAK